MTYIYSILGSTSRSGKSWLYIVSTWVSTARSGKSWIILYQHGFPHQGLASHDLYLINMGFHIKFWQVMTVIFNQYWFPHQGFWQVMTVIFNQYWVPHQVLENWTLVFNNQWVWHQLLVRSIPVHLYLYLFM
jgi:hypothetical protein